MPMLVCVISIIPGLFYIWSRFGIEYKIRIVGIQFKSPKMRDAYSGIEWKTS